MVEKRRVEVYVQDLYYQSSPENAVENGDENIRIFPETWESWFSEWVNLMGYDIPPRSRL